MSKPKLHLDADASQPALLEALLQRGLDVTSTPQPGLPSDADDEIQLLWSAGQGRILFTHNIRNFTLLAAQFPNFAGILLGNRSKLNPAELTRLIDRALTTTRAEEWKGQVRWLSDWDEDEGVDYAP